jgi:hypothetical protein
VCRYNENKGYSKDDSLISSLLSLDNSESHKVISKKDVEKRLLKKLKAKKKAKAAKKERHKRLVKKNRNTTTN